MTSVIKRVSYNGILFLLLGLSLVLQVDQLGAQAPKIIYVYDDLGRLLQVINQNNECATYAYDAVGNILKITRTTNCLQAPTVVCLSQDTAQVGDRACLTIIGTNFLGATVTTDNPEVQVSDIEVSDTGDTVEVCLAISFLSRIGPTKLIITTVGGMVERTFTINPNPCNPETPEFTTVVGRTLDQQANPVQGAQVRVPTTPGSAGVTDSQGRFTLANISACGQVQVIADAVLNGVKHRGVSGLTSPVVRGTTDVGDIVLQPRTVGEWFARAPLPTPRGALIAETLQDGIHVVGGSINYGGGRQFTAHEVYVPATDTWTTKAPAPDLNMWDPASAVVGGKLYLLEGWPGGSFTTREYDPTTDAWRNRASIPAGGFSWGHAAALVNNQIYVIGGSNGPKILRYDPAADTWTSGLAPIPLNRAGLAAGAIDGKIYVVGTGTQLQIYDPTTNTWTQGVSLPVATIAPSVAVFQGELFVFGGSTGGSGGNLNAVQIYDPGTNTWELGPIMPTVRSWSAAAVHGTSIYVLGGFNVYTSAIGANEQLD